MKQICYGENDSPYACGDISKTYLKEILNGPGYEKNFCYYSNVINIKELLAT